ncbi:energy transducer TonB [Sorangium sp. So ce233]|uniref:energy transducer TonB n=1 Tax=Sorangium sp. So ce233 TaxID=3133290 RepID=UPI003F60BD3B
MRTALVVLLPLLAACERPEPAPPAQADAGTHTPWTRDSAAPLDHRSGSLRTAGAAAVSSAEPEALEEILAAARQAAPRPGDGGTIAKIGTSTGVPEPSATPAASAPPPAPAPRSRVEIGAPTVQVDMSSPAIEKAARAQLYWDLVQRCRGPDGKILPPDVIRVEFNVDADGYIVAPTIIGSASDPRYDDAATCMRRELSAATFRAPAGARGLPTRVDATVPSVD